MLAPQPVAEYSFYLSSMRKAHQDTTSGGLIDVNKPEDTTQDELVMYEIV